jgi:urate oxidase
VRDLTVAVRLEGDFADAHVKGDNAKVLPTDTMKNTVYALAAEHPLDSIESFGLTLSRHFLEGSAAPRRVAINLVQHPWERIATDAGAPHPNAFVRPGLESRTALVERTREGVSVEAGLAGLLVLKSSGSAFAGFLRDRFTTLRGAHDRIFATAVTARWKYADADLAWELLARVVRRTLLETFAGHDSASVQHTLHAMGEAVLERHPEVAEIELAMPNKHHIPVDLAPFGLENRNEIFVATEEPYGDIRAVLRRG